MFGSAFPLVVFGGLTVAMGAVAVHCLRSSRRARATLSQMAATSRSSIADAAPNGPVELAGIAVPLGESSLTEAPLSGVPCLWWRVSIREVSGSSTREIANETDARDFYLDDGSGVVARVRTSMAKVGEVQLSPDPAHEERARRLLAKLGIDKPVQSLLWVEQRIDARSDVYVLGYARPAARSPAPDGPFRPHGFARERLVIEAPEGGELVVSVGGEAALSSKLRTDAFAFMKLARVFGVMAAFCAVALVVSAYLRLT